MKLQINNEPCLTDKDKIMVNAYLEDRIDIEKLKNNLDSNFTDAKISPSLGVLSVKCMGKTVMIFNSGKINIRKADNSQEASTIIHKIIKIIEKVKA